LSPSTVTSIPPELSFCAAFSLLKKRKQHPADHHAGQNPLVQFFGVGITHHPTFAKNGHPVAQFFYLIQLVADENNHLSVISHFSRISKKSRVS
jgi:hypothetical protein